MDTVTPPAASPSIHEPLSELALLLAHLAHLAHLVHLADLARLAHLVAGLRVRKRCVARRCADQRRSRATVRLAVARRGDAAAPR